MCVLHGAMCVCVCVCVCLSLCCSLQFYVFFKNFDTILDTSHNCMYFCVFVYIFKYNTQFFVYVRIKRRNMSLCCSLQFYAFSKYFDTFSNTTHNCAYFVYLCIYVFCVFVYIFKYDTQLLCMHVLQGAMCLCAVACNFTYSIRISCVFFKNFDTIPNTTHICMYFCVFVHIFNYDTHTILCISVYLCTFSI